jgi:pimeloyl-ACP methyl ester carboxylesterase
VRPDEGRLRLQLAGSCHCPSEHGDDEARHRAHRAGPLPAGEVVEAVRASNFEYPELGTGSSLAPIRIGLRDNDPDDRESGARVKAKLNGIEINYEVHGAGTPLVLAHGYTASLEMWREQATLSRNTGSSYDTRGQRHDGAPRQQYSSRADRGRPARADGPPRIGRAYVGGLSMGMIAQEFRAAASDRVKARCCSTRPWRAACARFAQMAQFQKMREMMQAAARTKGMSAIIDAMRDNAVAFRPSGGAPLPASVLRHVEGMRRMSVDGYLGGSQAMHEWAGTIDRLRSINVPTLCWSAGGPAPPNDA